MTLYAPASPVHEMTVSFLNVAIGLVLDCHITFSQVEIMMALEEKFGVSIGEGGAENIATVQDAADLIEKVKTASA